MKKIVHTFAIAALILLLTGLIAKVYVHEGFPYTHDGENHLARFANYKIALKEGQYPPRFAPNLMNHYGYPVFNYNYPLANILSLPFSFLKFNYQLTFKILATVSLLFGLVGMWSWLKKLEVKKNWAIFLALTNFATAPFIVSLFYHRGTIGEILAVMLLPWLFSGLTITKKREMKKINRLALFAFSCVLWSAFFLSHNITVMFGTAVLILYFIFQKPTVAEIKNKVVPFTLGLLSSLWFWLPAVLEKSFIVLDGASLSNGFKDHFVSISQLVLSPFGFGFSFIGSIDTLTVGVGVTSAFAVLTGILLFVKSFAVKNKPKLSKQNTILFLLLTLSTFSLLFQLPITEPIWSALPLIKYIQFPWRLTLFFVLSSSAILGILVEKINSKLFTGCLIFLLFFQVTTVFKAKAVDYFNRNIIDYDLYSQSTSTLNENLPISFTYEIFAHERGFNPATLENSGDQSIHVESWTGTNRAYTVDTNTQVIISEPTMYFPGWETRITPEKGRTYNAEYIDDKDIGGRIAYSLEPGSYSITTTFTQNTLPRIIGNTISISTIVITLIGVGWLSIKNEK